MTVQELIDKLSELPRSLPVAINGIIDYEDIKDQTQLQVKLEAKKSLNLLPDVSTEPDFLYVNIE